MTIYSSVLVWLARPSPSHPWHLEGKEWHGHNQDSLAARLAVWLILNRGKFSQEKSFVNFTDRLPFAKYSHEYSLLYYIALRLYIDCKVTWKLFCKNANFKTFEKISSRENFLLYVIYYAVAVNTSTSCALYNAIQLNLLITCTSNRIVAHAHIYTGHT